MQVKARIFAAGVAAVIAVVGVALGQQLPEGHPPIGGMMMDGGVMGAPVEVELEVRGRQGTAGGGSLAGDEGTVRLYAGEVLVKEVAVKLGEDGVAKLEGLTIDRAVQALVTVKHKGVDYEAVGGVLSGQQRRGMVDVTVYEPTQEAPAWTVKMRHVMVQATAAGLMVAEVVVVENPSDRAWLGAAGADGKRRTVAVGLPANLRGLQVLAGLEECCTTLGPGELASAQPLLPGEQRLAYMYEVPAKDGQAEVRLSAAAPTQRLVVFLPNDGTTVTAEGLEAMGAMKMGEVAARAYRAQAVAAGETVVFVVDGLSKLLAPQEMAKTRAAATGKWDSATMAKAAVGLGAAVAGMCVVAMMVWGKKEVGHDGS